jgi:hypothetical protein
MNEDNMNNIIHETTGASRNTKKAISERQS